MRLIIVEDQLSVLKEINKMLENLSDKIDIIKIYCNTRKELMNFNPDEKEWHNIYTEEELYAVCTEELNIKSDDHYLLDITLFREDQMDMEFSDYISVKLANYIINKDENVRIMFYTHPLGISVRDFASETKKWGEPIYRPRLDSDNDNDDEKEAKKQFVEEIKEYCNVQ